MPIANCFIRPECQAGSGNLVQLWASESGMAAKHMTMNLVKAEQQFGAQYKVMANLWLPSLWSAPDISALQIGLARALASYYELPIAEVLVVTQIIESSRVVENGLEVSW